MELLEPKSHLTPRFLASRHFFFHHGLCEHLNKSNNFTNSNIICDVTLLSSSMLNMKSSLALFHSAMLNDLNIKIISGWSDNTPQH